MSLKVTTRKPIQLQETDEQFAEAFDLYKAQAVAMLDKAWKSDTYGKEKPAYQGYKGVAYFYLLHTYAQMMDAYKIRMDYTKPSCPATELREVFKIDCIEANLSCLSKAYKVDYRAVWEGLKKIYDIDLDESKCGECCFGIGEMVVDGDDCEAFIVGPCN